jgi:hypothetical protein
MEKRKEGWKYLFQHSRIEKGTEEKKSLGLAISNTKKIEKKGRGKPAISYTKKREKKRRGKSSHYLHVEERKEGKRKV